MKKRILAMLLAGSMIFGLAACSGGGSTETTPAETGSAETTPAETDGAKTVKVGHICIGDENDQG